MILRHDLLLTRAAEFSEDGLYRYRLRYCFNGSVLDKPANPVVFAMLNPSTATELAPDRTISRCIDFARRWGHSDLLVVNVFALRSTDPRALLPHPDPVGPENDDVLASVPFGVPVIAGWGNHEALRRRIGRVVELLSRPILCLKHNKDGSPSHPLYLKAELKPVPWAPPERKSIMKDNSTFIALVLDRSGSMADVKADTIGGFNQFLEEQKKVPGEALFTLVQFDHEYQLVHDGAPIQTVQPLTESTYVPRGQTALLDAIGRTIVAVGAKLSAIPESDRPAKIIMVIQTDGHENASKEFDRAKIFEMITHQREKYSWDFVFLGAGQDAIATAGSVGIAAAAAASYVSAGTGTSDLLRDVGKRMGSYRSGNLRGDKFFDPAKKS